MIDKTTRDLIRHILDAKEVAVFSCDGCTGNKPCIIFMGESESKPSKCPYGIGNHEGSNMKWEEFEL